VTAFLESLHVDMIFQSAAQGVERWWN